MLPILYQRPALDVNRQGARILPVIMDRERIGKALTFDNHYYVMGKEVLPGTYEDKLNPDNAFSTMENKFFPYRLHLLFSF